MKKILILLLSSTILWFPSQAFSIQIPIGPGINKPVQNLKTIKRRNVVSQTLDYSCGPASLATLLSYYFQDKVTEKQIIKYLLLTSNLEKIKERKGFSLLDLKNFAKARGYKVTGFKMDLEYLVNLNKPVLIPMKIKDYSHFVVFRGMKGDRVFLADPALGNMTMKVDKFMSLWKDGIGLVVSKKDKRLYNPPLLLTKEEEAVFADPAMIRQIFGVERIGKVYSDGEF
jgi:uncharacterized protein